MRAVAEGEIAHCKPHLRVALRIDCDVSHVAGVMAFGIIESVLLAVGIEVRACGFEVRAIAFRILMKVNPVFTGRQTMQFEVDPEKMVGLLPKNGPTNAVALGILKFD